MKSEILVLFYIFGLKKFFCSEVTNQTSVTENVCIYEDLLGRNHTLRYYSGINLGQSFVDYVERGHQCEKKVSCQSTYELKIEECSEVEKLYNVTCDNLDEFEFTKTGGFPRCCLNCTKTEDDKVVENTTSTEDDKVEENTTKTEDDKVEENTTVN